MLVTDITLSMANFATFYRGSLFKGYTSSSEFSNGGFCATFKLSNNGQYYAYRVPHSTPANAEYQQKVIKWLEQVNSNYLAKFGEEDRSLLVNGKLLNVSYMQWIEGLTLGDYIKANYADKTTMINLANNFLTLTQWLHDNQISHGDLNDHNIMVRPDGSLVLIDYDTLCFASIEGKYNETSVGKANYQHPSRMQGQANKLSLKADYPTRRKTSPFRGRI
jgi:serine/threonine protein kinase